jgi:predicted nucleotidyltransferase
MSAVMAQKAAGQDYFEGVGRIALEECRKHYGSGLISVAIFGSVACGVATPESDVDLLIVADRLVPGHLNRMDDFRPVEESILGRMRDRGELSPIFKTPAEVRAGSPLFWDMTEEVIILFDRDRFLEGSLEEVKRSLQALGARRVKQGSAWYWILKKDYRPGEVFEI